LRAESRLELEELRGIDQTCDDLAYVIGDAIVDRYHTAQLIGAVARLPRGLAVERRQSLVPSERAHDLARDAQGVGIVFGEILRHARYGGVHLGPAEFLVAGNLAGGGLQQRWTGEEDLRTSSYHDNVVAQPRVIGASGGRGAMHNGYMGNAHG